MPTIKTKIQVDVSTWTFLKILILVLVIWFLYLIREILAIYFFTSWPLLLIHLLIGCIAKNSRAFDLFIYPVLLGIMSLIMSLLIPAIITQSQELFFSSLLY